MELKQYLKGKNRAAFAKATKNKVSYINNLCQHPEQCGKKTAYRIFEATGGLVTPDEMMRPRKKQAKK
jgi:hypothetical protein